jgi:predicted RNA-binding protein with PIN domain
MRYLIDGYNLLLAVWPESKRARPQAWEAQRLRLLEKLRHAVGFDVASLTVVFDAQNARGGFSKEQDYHGVRVLFAVKETADDLIETLLRGESQPKMVTVVSNDNRLQEAARRRGAGVTFCLDFFENLSKRPAVRATAADATAKPDVESEREKQRLREVFGDMDEFLDERDRLNKA